MPSDGASFFFNNDDNNYHQLNELRQVNSSIGLSFLNSNKRVLYVAAELILHAIMMIALGVLVEDQQ